VIKNANVSGRVHNSYRAPATMKNEGLADASAANPFRLPRLHPGIGNSLAVDTSELATAGRRTTRVSPPLKVTILQPA